MADGPHVELAVEGAEEPFDVGEFLVAQHDIAFGEGVGGQAGAQHVDAVQGSLDAAGIVESYKKLANVERDFRIIKTDDLDLRPIYHRLDQRVRAHVQICLLACYLIWHLRKAWAPLTYTDEHPPARDNPVAPAQRSAAANAKAATKRDTDGNPLRSFRGLIDHLGTLTRDRIRYHDTDIEIDKLTEPTPDQRRAFDLINSTIPLTIAA